jgi:deoxyhypusine synthase
MRVLHMFCESFFFGSRKCHFLFGLFFPFLLNLHSPLSRSIRFAAQPERTALFHTLALDCCEVRCTSMAGVAESAVLVSSAEATKAVAKLKRVQGPSSEFHDPEHILNCYPAMGFQATNFGHACHIAESMLRRQAPSKVYQMRDGKYVLVRQDGDDANDAIHDAAAEDVKTSAEENTGVKGKPKRKSPRVVYPKLFLGVTANLLGTGCREAVRFLVQEGVVPNPAAQSSGEVPQPPDDASEDQLMFAQLKREYLDTYGTHALADEAPATFHSFLCAVVVSGGGVEHDVRRACVPYTVTHYASEDVGRTTAAADTTTTTSRGPAAAAHRLVSLTDAHFGNVSYPSQGSEASALFDCVMRLFVRRLCARQQRLRAATAAKPIPEKYLDVCSWSVTPSEAWALLGLWLVDIMAEALHTLQHQANKKNASRPEAAKEEGEGGSTDRVEGTDTVVHAAASETCESCRAAALEKARTTVVYWAAVQQVPLFSPSFVDGDIASYLLPNDLHSTASDATAEAPLQLDLVRDIHAINKLAMQSKKTGMIICGGGVVKHHVCNANLMRNGADYTIILNNGQEFDGSDAGAKPEEALSWGKVRMEGKFVKVYGEVTTYLPLLVARVFVPAVRRRRRQHPGVASAAQQACQQPRPQQLGRAPREAGSDKVVNDVHQVRQRRRGQRGAKPAATASTPADGARETASEPIPAEGKE